MGVHLTRMIKRIMSRRQAVSSIPAVPRPSKPVGSIPFLFEELGIMPWKMATMPLEKRLFGYIVEQKRFSSKASIAGDIAEGAPYALIWSR